MIRRRTANNPLEPTLEPRWYTVRSMHGALLEARALPRGSDLKQAFVRSMLEWLEAGWRLEEFSSASGTFFCSRGTERRMVGISAGDPEREHRFGAAHVMAGPVDET